MSDTSPEGGATLQLSGSSRQEQVLLGQMHHSQTPQLTLYSPELLLPPSSLLAIGLTPNSISQHSSEILRLPLILPLSDQSDPVACVTGLITFSSAQSTAVLSQPQVLGVSQLAPYTLSAMMPHMAPPLPSNQPPMTKTQELRNHTAAQVTSTQLPLCPQPSQTNQPSQETTLPSTDKLPTDTRVTQLTTDTKSPSTEPPTSVIHAPTHNPLSQIKEQQPLQNQPASKSEEQDPQITTSSLYPSLPPAVLSVPADDPLRELSEQGSVLEEGGVGLTLPTDASEKEAGKSGRVCVLVDWSIFQWPNPELLCKREFIINLHNYCM